MSASLLNTLYHIYILDKNVLKDVYMNKIVEACTKYVDKQEWQLGS